MREVETKTKVEARHERRMPTRSTDETVRLGTEIYERTSVTRWRRTTWGKFAPSTWTVDVGLWAMAGLSWTTTSH